MAAVSLKNKQKTIFAISLEVGYQSETHSSKAFKATYGLSPSQFRRAYPIVQNLRYNDHTLVGTVASYF